MNLNIIEIFKSVQGETSLTGLPTTFIRLAACNLRCAWCDTSYSFGKGTPLSIEEILQQTRKNQCHQVCITGGEPLLQNNVHVLINALINENYFVSIETGGSLSIDQIHRKALIVLDIKCPASQMSHKNLWSNLAILPPSAEVKFVIADLADYEYAKNVCTEYQLYTKASEVLFSPVFDSLDAKTLVEWILHDNLPIRLNLQVHKFIWTPTTRGV